MRSVLLLGLSLVSSLALAQEPEGADAPTEAGAIPPSPDGPARPPEPPDANTNLSKLLSLEEQLEALKAEIEAQQRAIDTQQELLDAQAETIDAQATALDSSRAQISKNSRALLPKDDVTISLEGYFRTRGYLFPNLYASQQEEGARDARFMMSRLRFKPKIAYRNLASLNMQIDMLDDVVWGDNQSLASTALFAGNPSFTNRDGRELPTIALKEAYVEGRLPVGIVRVGRQTSHWGLGLLANGGQGFDDQFGENYTGNQFDRVLFATRPVAIAQTIMGKEDTEVPFLLGVAVDRLVETPLIRYYGYKCESGILESETGYDARCDSRGDGVTDLDHDYTDDTRTEDQRSEDWWALQDDDVYEMIYLAMYNGEDIDYLGGNGDLKAGLYVINRIQRETDSNVVIADVYFKAHVHGVYLELEALTIQGRTRAIALPGAFDPFATDVADPLEKKANIWGYAAKAGYTTDAVQLMLEHGYASGDDDPADINFTGRSLHPDYNVGLLLYEEVLRRVTREFWAQTGQGLWSQGGVWNSRYLFPTVTLTPDFPPNWSLVAGFLMAWPDKADGRFIQCRPGEGCAQESDDIAKMLGWEADLALKHTWHNHLHFTLETGFARATNRVPLEAAGLNPNGNFFTLQTRFAYTF